MPNGSKPAQQHKNISSKKRQAIASTETACLNAVSYNHLTLQTKLEV
ncbi:MAG: hypothetical protein K2G69_06335 [Muribaculaceae bacterium]|nr:hypothetical protein [Muribaculaceae bacterium]